VARLRNADARQWKGWKHKGEEILLLYCLSYGDKITRSETKVSAADGGVGTSAAFRSAGGCLREPGSPQLAGRGQGAWRLRGAWLAAVFAVLCQES